MYKNDSYINRLEGVLLLACKCVFYRSEYNAIPMELTFEGLEMQ